MKRVAVIMIVIMLISFISGCQPTGEVKNTESLKKEITIYNGVGEKNQESFIQYLNDNYDIVLSSPNWDNQNPIENPKGFLKIGFTELKTIFDDRHNRLEPLNDYMGSNSTLNSLPDVLSKAVMDSDGNIWGLLYSHRFETVSRVYNPAIMNQLGASAPKDINQLKELLLNVKTTIDFPIIKVSGSDCVGDLYDIFAAFQCPIYNNRYTIGWSVEKNEFVDSATSAEMVASLTYIKELVDNGIIEAGTSPGTVLESEFENNKLFTITKYNSLGVDDEYYSCALSDSRIPIEIGIENSPFIYVLPKGIENPETTLDDFISSFYANEKVNKSGRYGIEETHYTYIDENFVVIGNDQPSSYPMITDYWINNTYISLKSTSEKDNYLNWIDVNKEIYANAFYDGHYYIIPVEKTLGFERMGMMDPNEAVLHNKFSEMLYRFIEEKQSIEAFLAEYKNEMERLGIADYLEKMNSN